MRMFLLVAALVIVASASAVNICIPSCVDRAQPPSVAPVAANPAVDAAAVAQVTPEQREFGASIVKTARQFVGQPYVPGGSCPLHGGFDCSGLVQYVFSQNGVSVPRTASEQYNYGVKVPRSELIPGDLVYFAPPSHVGIYAGSGRMIAAPGTGQRIKEQNVYTSYLVQETGEVNRFVSGVRIPAPRKA